MRWLRGKALQAEGNPRWCGLILRAPGGNPLRSRGRREPQRLHAPRCVSVVGRDDPCDLVERQFLKPSCLLHAAADQPISDGTETTTAGPGARRFYPGEAIAPTIVPVTRHKP
jgi:hypothetical protein